MKFGSDDKADGKPGLFARLKGGLSKSAAGLTGFFTKKKLDAATIAELEEALIKSDMGAGPARALVQAVAKNHLNPKARKRHLNYKQYNKNF